MQSDKELDEITVLATIETALNDIDAKIIAGEEQIAAMQRQLADIKTKRQLAADALARVKDRMMSRVF